MVSLVERGTNSDAKNDVFCGFLELEEKENSGVFVLKFVRLDTATCRLDYYPDTIGKQNDLQSNLTPDGSFNICFLSMAADAASARPKISNCFYIVVSGRKYYFKASSNDEKNLWIEKLQDASRITVPLRDSLMDSPSVQTGLKVEVVGGVIFKTPMDCLHDVANEVDLDDSVQRSMSPLQHVEEASIKMGYCTKQGIFRKSWKRRYFILSASTFRYCLSAEDKTPIKIIKVLDILEARPSIGIHLNRENLFEVVTPGRVFYIQAESETERDSWIDAINQCLQAAREPKVLMTSV